jgi:hypothetical protein
MSANEKYSAVICFYPNPSQQPGIVVDGESLVRSDLIPILLSDFASAHFAIRTIANCRARIAIGDEFTSYPLLDFPHSRAAG